MMLRAFRRSQKPNYPLTESFYFN